MFDSSRRSKTCPLFEMAVVAASAMSFLCLIFNYPILIYVSWIVKNSFLSPTRNMGDHTAYSMLNAESISWWFTFSHAKFWNLCGKTKRFPLFFIMDYLTPNRWTGTQECIYLQPCIMHGILIHFEGNVHYVVLKSVISEPPWRIFCNFVTKFT